MNMHLSIVLCCGKQVHCLPIVYDKNMLSVSQLRIYPYTKLICFSVPSSRLHEQAYSSCFSCGTCIKQRKYGDIVKIIVVLILVNELHKHAAPIRYFLCVMYIIALFTNKIIITKMLSQCRKIVVHFRLYSCSSLASRCSWGTGRTSGNYCRNFGMLAPPIRLLD